MLGLSAFAQSPFAALSGTTFAVSVDETVTLTDAWAAQAAFAGLEAESIALTEQDPATFDFVGTDANTFSLADLYTGNVDALVDQIGRAHV